MLKHHEDSIKIMISHYREDSEITALFLTGSVATGTERLDSDLDGVAVVSQE
jgi:predicted nucleotidyltransferase